MEISDYTWNYYLYVVINLNNGEQYETDDLDDARQVKTDWQLSGYQVIIQQQHNVARIIS